MIDKIEKVLVEILQGTQPTGGGWSCSGCSVADSCGSAADWEEETRKLSDQLKASFGDKVDVKLVDVDKVGLANYPMMSRILEMGYPYPITLINGQPKFAGGILGEDIKTSIEEILA